jgi:hypothetical protein
MGENTKAVGEKDLEKYPSAMLHNLTSLAEQMRYVEHPLRMFKSWTVAIAPQQYSRQMLHIRGSAFSPAA